MRLEQRPPIRSGSLFLRSFRVFVDSLPQFFPLALLILSPLAILDYQDVLRSEHYANPMRDFLGLLAQTILNNILTGALVFGVIQHLAGQRMILGECIAQSMRRLLLIVMVTLLFGLMIGAGVVLALLGGFALTVLVVPGLYLITIFFLSVPVAVVEGGSATNALRRSLELTRGHRWKVFAVIAMIGICFLAFAMVGGLLIFAFGEDNPISTAVILLIYKAFSGVLFAVTAAVIYHDLRAGQDDFSVKDLSKVFE